MIGRILHRVHGGSVEALRRLARVRDLARLMGDPKLSQTYFPEQERKSRFREWVDQLYWLARHGEVNPYYWQFGLDRRHGPRLNDYISFREFITLRDQANSIAHLNGRYLNYRCLLRDKLLFGAYCQTLGIPSAKVLARVISGELRWLDTHCIEPIAAITRHGGLSAFCKDQMGERGHDVFAVSVQDGRLFLDAQPASVEDFAGRVRNRRFILQQALRQHEQLARLHPASVNSLRLITLHDADRVIPFASIIRVGVGGCGRDNAAQGGICVDLDWEQEVLFRHGFFLPGMGTKTTVHPDTGIAFEGYPVPFAREAMRQAVRIHQEMFPGLFSIGWDIAITEDGPVIFEANDGWEFTLKPNAQGFDRKEFRHLCAQWLAQHELKG